MISRSHERSSNITLRKRLPIYIKEVDVVSSKEMCSKVSMNINVDLILIWSGKCPLLPLIESSP